MATSPDFSSAGSLGKLLEQIVNAIGKQGLGTTTNYQDEIMQRQKQMFNDPLGSGIFQGLVGTVLDALRPGEAQAAQNLQDMFRSSGGGASALQSGAFAKQGQLLQGNILRNQSQAISGLAQNSMGQLMQALQQGFNMGEPNRNAPLDQIKLLLGALTGGIGLSGAQNAAQRPNPVAASSGPSNALLEQLLRSLGSTGTSTSTMTPSSGSTGWQGPGELSGGGGNTGGGLGTGYIPGQYDVPAGYVPYGYDTFGGEGVYFDPNPQQDQWY